MAEQTKQNHYNLVQSLCNANNIASLSQLEANQFLLEFINGELKADEASFVKTDSGDEFVMLPREAITHILGTLKNSHEETTKIMLRHAIRDLIPFDIEDAMAVAMYELEKYRLDDGNLPIVNVKNLAKEIRINHPNLFIQF
ncbi:DUF2603 domain-containing protein [Helicobacter didelphidarum]|uniref:DUF2603 domain-containing protein n=1 Tax=Helicobacter didelphidarum TaxID=2040648 RepID=A0A3D8IEL0_9HELI|nr:DUF2603 domain-containing protein [Helicobacter didelphidarum]RDU63592.1 DUF2603 domain-containing protein [Helicobacter didelphidarum]